LDVWTHLHHYFDTDDGSLPELGFATASASEVAAMFDFVRKLGQTDRGEQAPVFWDRELEASVRIDAVPNAAALVAANRAEPFAMVMTEVRFDGVSIPNLGVFVFPDLVDLYYRAGSDWTPQSLHAFLRLLLTLQALAPGARLQFEREFGNPQVFLEVWAHLNTVRTPDSLQGTP
jgi:hypothetical protein